MQAIRASPAIDKRMPTLRVLGLDVGDRRIGIALSDALGLTAQQLMVLERRGVSTDARAVERLVMQHQVDRLVVGLPLTMAGAQGPQAKKVMTFIATLRPRLSVPIHWIDERLTTVQGRRALQETGTSRRKRRQVIDQVAAQLILQQFLDMAHPRSA